MPVTLKMKSFLVVIVTMDDPLVHDIFFTDGSTLG